MKVSTTTLFIVILSYVFNFALKYTFPYIRSHCCIIIEIENYHFYCCWTILAFSCILTNSNTFKLHIWHDDALALSFDENLLLNKLVYRTNFPTYFPIITLLGNNHAIYTQQNMNFLMVEFIWHLSSLTLCDYMRRRYASVSVLCFNIQAKFVIIK